VYCYNCQKKVDLEGGKVPFRSSCPFCDFDLHICKNCKFYSEGKPHDCNVPDIEPVKDKEKYNFCEEFQPNDQPEEKKSSSSDDISQKLFGEKQKKKKDFGSLFDD